MCSNTCKLISYLPMCSPITMLFIYLHVTLSSQLLRVINLQQTPSATDSDSMTNISTKWSDWYVIFCLRFDNHSHSWKPHTWICCFCSGVKEHCSAVSIRMFHALGAAVQIACNIHIQLSNYTYTFPLTVVVSYNKRAMMLHC